MTQSSGQHQLGTRPRPGDGLSFGHRDGVVAGIVKHQRGNRGSSHDRRHRKILPPKSNATLAATPHHRHRSRSDPEQAGEGVHIPDRIRHRRDQDHASRSHAIPHGQRGDGSTERMCDHRVGRAHRLDHRAQGPRQLRSRGTSPTRGAMPRPVVRHWAESRREKPRNEGGESSAPAPPTVHQHHGGSVSPAPRPDSPALGRDVEGAGGGDGGLVRRRQPPSRWREEEALHPPSRQVR
jgi:hypothetical protein